MPDYSKTNAASMNADIAAVQALWESLMDKDSTHLVIAVQKELVMKNPHFFWGKCDMMTLEPLSCDEIVEAYKYITGDSCLFDEPALRLIATLSRGVFRRFKKYVRLTIENNLEEFVPLKQEHVEKAVGEKQLFEDMELELCDIFNEREKRLQALSVISFLRKQGKTNIKTISEGINLTESVTQKITHKLVLYGYVCLERGLGKEKLVCLRL
jgi:hypothetical protein